MSVIVYKNGIIASDTQTNRGWTIFTKKAQKIVRIGNYLIGGTGGCSYFASYCKFVEKTQTYAPYEKDKLAPNTTFLIWDIPNQKMYLFDSGKYPQDVPISSGTKIAIGGGGDMAMGAMLYGASAIEGVRLCIENRADCGGNIVAYDCRTGKQLNEIIESIKINSVIDFEENMLKFNF